MSGQSPAPAAGEHPAAVSNGSLRRARTAKKRMLVIVNPYATTVSDRLKNLVVYALQGRYRVEAVATGTNARCHAAVADVVERHQVLRERDRVTEIW